MHRRMEKVVLKALFNSFSISKRISDILPMGDFKHGLIEAGVGVDNQNYAPISVLFYYRFSNLGQLK